MIYTNTNIKKAGHNWYQTDKKSISGFMKNYSYFIFKASLDYQLNINQASKKSEYNRIFSNTGLARFPVVPDSLF